MAHNSGNIAIAFLLLMICAASARAESQAVPPDTWLFPPGGPEASSFDLAFAQGVNNASPTQLRFDGNIHNSSFLNGANASLWFDWMDADGTPHASQPEAFTLTPIMGMLYSHRSEYFSREVMIPYSPAELSVHFANVTADSIDGRPLLVTVVLTTVPEPSALILGTIVCSILAAGRRRRKSVAALMRVHLALAMILAWAVSASAITIDTVPVVNAGNSADTRYIDSSHPNGVGSVAQPFNIGKTEVTNAQYVEFLNAVAASDPYALYNPIMDSYRWGGIVRSGAFGHYTYAVQAAEKNGTYLFDNKPVLYVSSGDVMRFANWLHNGQPTGAEDTTTTEDGAYTLNGATTSTSLAAVTRNASARWWVPSEDEWYKTAYHKNDGVTGNYWEYPTSSDSVPDNNQLSSDSGNSVNYYVNDFTTGDVQLPLTDVGAYTLSRGPYGTFDQAGNVWEWNDTLFDNSFRGIRGSCWGGGSGSLRAADGRSADPTYEENSLGFRVASMAIPEPLTILSAIAAFTGLLTVRRKSVARNRV